MKSRFASLLLAVVVGSWCALAADSRGGSEPAVVLMTSFRKEVGVTFKECPDEKCVEAALRTCAPVHALSRFTTVEGTPAVIDYFVVKRPEGCRLVTFADYTKDYWGGCKVRKHVCPSLKASKSDDPERLGCTPSEVLFTASICPNPMQRMR